MIKRPEIKLPMAALLAASSLLTAPKADGESIATIKCPIKTLQTEERKENVTGTNGLFLRNYALARQELIKKLGPVIICRGDTISLIKNGDTISKKFIKTDYSILKEFAHVTLGTYVILVNHTDTQLSKSTLDKLEQFNLQVALKLSTVNKLSLKEKQKYNQKMICMKTIAFINGAMRSETVSKKELRQYTRSVAQLTLRNAEQAAESQLTEIDHIVKNWMSKMTPEETKALHIVIETGHMPRKQQASLQYFQNLFDEERVGKKIIAAESIPGDKAISLLATHVLDEQVAIDFYADPWRMHKDLLADGAAKFLKKTNPKNLNHKIKSTLFSK